MPTTELYVRGRPGLADEVLRPNDGLDDARARVSPGRGRGRLVIADWGRPDGLLTGAGVLLLRGLDGFENTAHHAAGRLPALIEEAGFIGVRTRQRWSTVWGSLELTTAEEAWSETLS